jgi:hypothetical protein
MTENEGLRTSPGQFPEHLKVRTPTRTIISVLITANFLLVVGPLWNHSTMANAGQNVAKSIDPAAMTLDAAGMPTYVGP